MTAAPTGWRGCAKNWRQATYFSGIALAFLAVVEAVVTYAAPSQQRPRVLALVFAATSLVLCGVGWRWLPWSPRFDAVLAMAADVWVLFDGGW